MTEVSGKLVAALNEVAEVLGSASGKEAARVAVDFLRARVGESVFPSVYREHGDHLWVVAEAGYSSVYDGLSLDFGVVGRAWRTGEVQYVPDASTDLDFAYPEEGLISQVVVPVGRWIVDIECTERLDPSVVAPFEKFARVLAEHITEEAEPDVAVDIARSLSTMVGLPSIEEIARYAIGVIATLLNLTFVEAAITGPDSDPIGVTWHLPDFEPPGLGAARVMEVARRYSGYSASLGGRPDLMPEVGGVDHWIVLPIAGRGGVIGGIVGAGSDPARVSEPTSIAVTVTAHAAACIERARLEAEYVSALASRRDFVAGISHELRTPLTAIIGYTDLVLSGDASDAEEVREFVGAARAGAQHLLTLVTDLLDVAKADSGRLHVNTNEVVRLKPLVDHVLGLVGPQCVERNVVVTVDVSGALVVRGDETRVRQILVNLLSNAVKFTHDAGVHVTADLDGGFVTVQVVDEGIGISAAGMRTLFRPFSSAAAGQAPSTGLGLVISRRLAEAMGGSLDLYSQGTGRGATAVFTVPGWADPSF